MKNRITSTKITKLKENEIFVFGSNKDCNHAGGAAKLALEKFGAINGSAQGLQGRSYAINTMSGIETIKTEIETFLNFAKQQRFFKLPILLCSLTLQKILKISICRNHFGIF